MARITSSHAAFPIFPFFSQRNRARIEQPAGPSNASEQEKPAGVADGQMIEEDGQVEDISTDLEEDDLLDDYVPMEDAARNLPEKEPGQGYVMTSSAPGKMMASSEQDKLNSVEPTVVVPGTSGSSVSGVQPVATLLVGTPGMARESGAQQEVRAPGVAAERASGSLQGATLGGEPGKDGPSVAHVGAEPEDRRVVPVEEPLASLSFLPAGEDPTPPLGPLLEKALAEIQASGGMVTGHPAGDKEGVSIHPSISKAVGSLTTPERWSRRRAGSADEDSLTKASRLVAKRNLEEQDGGVPRNVLDSLLGPATKRERKTSNKFGVPCA